MYFLKLFSGLFFKCVYIFSRDIIVEDSLTLKYYGIKECLQDQNVQSLVSGIADKNNCILTQNLETAASLTDKDFDAEAQSASGGSEIKEGKALSTLKQNEIYKKICD